MPLYYSVVLAAALLAALPALADQPIQALSLKQAEALALSQSPTLAAAKENARAMAAIPPQAGSLPDPVLGLNAMNLPVDSFATTRENMTQLQIGLSQQLPFPGKLGLREEAARSIAASARFDVVETRLALIRNVRITWWNLFYLDRALEIVGRNKALLRQFITIAETKYKVGKGLQQDVLLAQVELSKLMDIEIRFKGARRDEEARLNELLNRPTHAAIRLSTQVQEALPRPPEEAKLHQLALEARPLLAGRNEKIKAARKRVMLAEKDYYPDFRLGGAYGFRSGTNPVNRRSRPDFASFMVAMNLPIYTSTKQDRALEQRKAEAAKEQFGLQDATQRVWAEASTALADYRRAREQVSLFKSGIIPQASQTVASMLAGYQVNKVDFLNLVRSQITLYNYETEYWKALAGAKQALARMNAAVGKDLIDLTAATSIANPEEDMHE